MNDGERAADDDRRLRRPRSPRGLLARQLDRIAHNTQPKPRKRSDEKTGRREVRGD